MEPEYLLEAKLPLIGIAEQLFSELALYFLNLFDSEKGHRDIGLEDIECFLVKRRIVGIDESVVIAEIGEVAGALVIDLCEECSKDGMDIFLVLGVIVYNVVGLLYDFEKISYFVNYMLIHWLFYLIQILLLSH